MLKFQPTSTDFVYLSSSIQPCIRIPFIHGLPAVLPCMAIAAGMLWLSENQGKIAKACVPSAMLEGRVYA